MFTGKVCMWSCCATRNMGNVRSKYFSVWAMQIFRVTEAPPVCIESSCCGCSRHVTSHVVVCAGAVDNSIRPICGLIPCRGLVWTIHSASFWPQHDPAPLGSKQPPVPLWCLVGPLSLPTLQLLPLLPACCSKTPLRQDFPQVCPRVRQ